MKGATKMPIRDKKQIKDLKLTTGEKQKFQPIRLFFNYSEYHLIPRRAAYLLGSILKTESGVILRFHPLGLEVTAATAYAATTRMKDKMKEIWQTREQQPKEVQEYLKRNVRQIHPKEKILSIW